MESLYKPAGVEERWQRTWEEDGLYRAGAGARSDETFVICVPPPNVTGALHMGHALNGSIQDVLIRWHRMRGFDTLWQPGYDHAGIATQNVVEKQLVREGTSRKELGREAFVERVWEHLNATGRTIIGQFRRLGASLDYERERFTMDDAYIEAVMRFFVHLWDRGWMYQANRIVNWCPFHETAISDLEVEHAEVDDALTYARYPFIDGIGRDHGRDRAAGDDARRRRRRRASGRRPLPRRDRQAGAHAVRRPAGAGDRRRARRPGVRDGRAEGDARARPARLRDRPRPRPARADGDRPGRAHERRRGRARRTHAGGGGRARARVAQGARPAREARELPPLRRHVRALPLADRAARSRCSGGARWRSRRSRRSRRSASGASATTHRRSTHSRLRSLEEIPDWNVSRQLWWGHQLPLWYCPDGHVTCAWPPPGRVRGVRRRRRSSATPTSSTRGSRPRSGRSRRSAGPRRREELRRYYPGDVNSTAREIIRLWENRMIWAGLELMGEIPFTDVIVHSTCSPRDGRRMSKSLGNGARPARDDRASTAPTRPAMAC